MISRQATINIGTIGHVAHGKSTVVKAISGVHTVRFKNELERNITIKLGKHSPFLLRSIIKMPSFKIQSYWFGHVANPKLDSTQYKTENQFYEWKKKTIENDCLSAEFALRRWLCVSDVAVNDWLRINKEYSDTRKYAPNINNWIIIIVTHISLHKNDIFPFTNDVSLFNYVFFCHLIFFLTAFLHTTILPKRPLRKSPFYTILECHLVFAPKHKL